MDDDRQDLHETLNRRFDRLETFMSDIQASIDALAANEENDIASIKTAVDAIKANLAAEVAKPAPDMSKLNQAASDLNALSVALTPPAPVAPVDPAAPVDPNAPVAADPSAPPAA